MYKKHPKSTIKIVDFKDQNKLWKNENILMFKS